MKKSKQHFSNSENYIPENDDTTIQESISEYIVRRTAKRKELTERDIRHNRNVTKLFNAMTPGLPIDREPAETREEPTPFSAIIDQVLQKLVMDESTFLNTLRQAWHTLVPPEVARIAQPGMWDKNILYIFVNTSPNLFEIRRKYLKQIDKSIRKFAPNQEIRHIRLMVNVVDLPQ